MGRSGVGSGTAASVKSISRDDVQQFHSSWFRPDKAKLFVVSDLPLAEVQPLLEARFGNWAASGEARRKNFAAPAGASPRIVLVDRKDSPQSLIIAAQLLPA